MIDNKKYEVFIVEDNEFAEDDELTFYMVGKDYYDNEGVSDISFIYSLVEHKDDIESSPEEEALEEHLWDLFEEDLLRLPFAMDCEIMESMYSVNRADVNSIEELVRIMNESFVHFKIIGFKTNEG